MVLVVDERSVVAGKKECSLVARPCGFIRMTDDYLAARRVEVGCKSVVKIDATKNRVHPSLLHHVGTRIATTFCRKRFAQEMVVEKITYCGSSALAPRIIATHRSCYRKTARLSGTSKPFGNSDHLGEQVGHSLLVSIHTNIYHATNSRSFAPDARGYLCSSTTQQRFLTILVSLCMRAKMAIFTNKQAKTFDHIFGIFDETTEL